MRFSKKYEKPRKKGGSVRYKTPDEAGAVNLNKDKPWVSLFRDIEITSFFCYNITSCISVQDDTDTFNSSMDYYWARNGRNITGCVYDLINFDKLAAMVILAGDLHDTQMQEELIHKACQQNIPVF